MKTKLFMLFIAAFAFLPPAKAQNTNTDSAAVDFTLKSLLDVCKNVDFGDPKTTSLGTFYKAAPYIVYQGSDTKRAWKAFADYSTAEEKKGVDEICTRINGSVNQDNHYEIIRYATEKESEGLWHVLIVSYQKNGVEKKAAFAFLKIGNRIGLGDID
jgi:hypothetical protein